MGPIADNVAITAGSGTTIRTKDRSGIESQIVLLDLNTGGSETLMTGSIPVRPLASATGTISSVSSTVTANTTLLASNANRLGATIFNESTAILYIAFGATCGPTLTPTTYTVQIAAGGFYELSTPAIVYTGVITCTWSAANGSARVTELT